MTKNNTNISNSNNDRNDENNNIVECDCVVVRQIDDQRHYIEKICRGEEHVFGLPHSIINKQLVSVLSDR